jgi:DNA mismatch repair ATPase MutL
MSRVICLSRDLGNSIRAPGLMPSYHSIVEELILNSLDASSTTIHIKCDLINFNVDVIDNGPGISQDDLKAGGLFGQWHASSKENTCTSFGFRGEAVAAISYLSDLTVFSKTNGSCTISSSLGRSACGTPRCGAEIDPFAGTPSGTLFRAKNIFGKLPVRQRNIKPALEVSLLKQFVEKMSVLHHSVQWTLEIAGHFAPIIQLPSAPSVASRFLSLASIEILSKMVSVDVECNGVRIVGLISPPKLDFCHFSKEYQYFFLEHRWMRGKDFASQTIQKLFSEYMRSVSGYSINARGPNPKHAMTGAHATHYPTYILQLLCHEPAKEYDLLAEPDKTVAIFRDPMRIYTVVDKMMKEISQNICLERIGSELLPLGVGLDINSRMSNPTYTIRETSGIATQSNINSNFRLSFLQSPNPTSDRTVQSGDDLRDDETLDRGAVSLDIFNEVNSQLDTNAEIGRIQSSVSFHYDHNRVNPSENISYDLSTYVCDSNHDSFEEVFFASPVSEVFDMQISKIGANSLSTQPLKKLFSQSFMREKNCAASLTKKLLQNRCSVVGQADKKCIILRVGNYLVAADQHAVDERVRLEELNSKCSHTVVSKQLTAKVLFVGSVGICIARDKSDILSRWAFTYTFCDDPNSLKLNTVPVINGEALTEADFVEFLFSLERDRGIFPDELCKPPAMSRIFASHACRNAIKFGDCISPSTCQNLISRLAVTDMPFQCAHGRVSMSPLVDLRTLNTEPHRQNHCEMIGGLASRTKPRYEHLYRL